MSLHPLVTRLLQGGGQAIAGSTPLPGGDQVLFFGGDPVRFPEVLDVAVVLPELQQAFGRRFGIGVIEPAEEDALARRYGVQRWPSLVFLRDGAYLDTVSGMHDWDDYLRLVGQALARTPGRAPSVGIPLVAAGGTGGDSHCH
jgi:hydrogenase-1 operon protein HyaE